MGLCHAVPTAPPEGQGAVGQGVRSPNRVMRAYVRVTSIDQLLNVPVSRAMRSATRNVQLPATD